MSISIFESSKQPQGKNCEELLAQGIVSYNNGSYDRAVEYFAQALEIQNASYEATYSDADRSALCSTLMLRARSLFMMDALQKAHHDFMAVYDLLGDIAVHQSDINDCKLLRQACEFGAATAEQTGDVKKQRELINKHLDISRRIFEATEMAEDYAELGCSYDYMITISESSDERICNAEKMKEVYQNLHKQIPGNAHFSERLDYSYEALEDQIKAKIAETLKREDYAATAMGYQRLATVKMEKTLGKKEVSYGDMDNNAECFHEAAKYFQKTGNNALAEQCLENAIQLRSAIVKATGADVARARLSYSYVMAIVTDPTIVKRAEYARLAYNMLVELEKKRIGDTNLKNLKEIASKFRD